MTLCIMWDYTPQHCFEFRLISHSQSPLILFSYSQTDLSKNHSFCTTSNGKWKISAFLSHFIWQITFFPTCSHASLHSLTMSMRWQYCTPSVLICKSAVYQYIKLCYWNQTHQPENTSHWWLIFASPILSYMHNNMLGHVLFISGEQSKAVGGVQNPCSGHRT